MAADVEIGKAEEVASCRKKTVVEKRYIENGGTEKVELWVRDKRSGCGRGECMKGVDAYASSRIHLVG
ncbi:hypothetical protein CBR_g57136 [Chara braunii]|uniref:Uncharacterized protein n=1 Tax=Chara braunii TaxID=69332 RepID=A0A388MDZ9_CHABU|nr:hypothetical protein CBR_g57136 [Chara braunii]|eukprot:GBG92786.1 hypothetical protein CBR_g57136 [Chara braunii]